MAAHLFLPSPSYKSHLWKLTSFRDSQGYPTHVDALWNIVIDTWRTRHSEVMRAISGVLLSRDIIHVKGSLRR